MPEDFRGDGLNIRSEIVAENVVARRLGMTRANQMARVVRFLRRQQTGAPERLGKYTSSLS